MKGRVEKELVLLKNKLTELQKEISPFKVYMQKGIPMLENLLEYHRKSGGATRKKIPDTIFAEELIVINGKVIEPIFTEPLNLILRIRYSPEYSRKRILGCNSDKKLVELLRLCQPKLQRRLGSGLRKSVRVSGCHKNELYKLMICF